MRPTHSRVGKTCSVDRQQLNTLPGNGAQCNISQLHYIQDAACTLHELQASRVSVI